MSVTQNPLRSCSNSTGPGPFNSDEQLYQPTHNDRDGFPQANPVGSPPPTAEQCEAAVEGGLCLERPHTMSGHLESLSAVAQLVAEVGRA